MKLRSRGKTRGLARIVALTVGGPRLSSTVFILLALALFTVSAARPGDVAGVRTRTADLFAPLLMAVNKPVQIAAGYVSTVSGLAGLQAENARLREENARLREWYQTALALRTENESLQKLLNISLPPQSSYVTARIISDAGNAYVHTQLVMAGKKTGVDKGQAVLAGEGLVGRVIEAGDVTARVLLLGDINSRVPVTVEGGVGVQAILAGTNAGLPVLDHLPPGQVLTEGARVITSGHGGLFPHGLPVGTVAAAPGGGWAVAPYADPARSVFVRIVNSGDDPRLRSGGL